VVSLRYTFGYLCAAFLVSAPLTLVVRQEAEWRFITFSLAYGGILGIAALLFIPLADIDWRKMTVPSFKLFELGVSRNASIIALILLVCGLVTSRFFPPAPLAGVVLMLMVFNYLRGKAHSWLFRDFYEMEEERHRRASGMISTVIEGFVKKGKNGRNGEKKTSGEGD
jgi:hypothetical protein